MVIGSKGVGAGEGSVYLDDLILRTIHFHNPVTSGPARSCTSVPGQWVASASADSAPTLRSLNRAPLPGANRFSAAGFRRSSCGERDVA